MGLLHLKAPAYACGNVFRSYQKNLNSHFIPPPHHGSVLIYLETVNALKKLLTPDVL